MTDGLATPSLGASKQHTGSRLTPPMKSILKEQQAFRSGRDWLDLPALRATKN